MNISWGRRWAAYLLRPVFLGTLCFGVGALFATSLLVPTMWSEKAAGWASAISTFLAVVAALVIADRQVEVAREAAAAERTSAIELQQTERAESSRRDLQRAVRLAHAFARELGYARRELAIKLVNWTPARMTNPTPAELDGFVMDRPLPDLSMLTSFSSELEGFADDDAFAILSVLATWNFYNRPPGLERAEINAMGPVSRGKMAAARCRFGLELFELMGELINKLYSYYESHAAISGRFVEDLPPGVSAELSALKFALTRHDK